MAHFVKQRYGENVVTLQSEYFNTDIKPKRNSKDYGISKRSDKDAEPRRTEGIITYENI